MILHVLVKENLFLQPNHIVPLLDKTKRIRLYTSLIVLTCTYGKMHRVSQKKNTKMISIWSFGNVCKFPKVIQSLPISWNTCSLFATCISLVLFHLETPCIKVLFKKCYDTTLCWYKKNLFLNRTMYHYYNSRRQKKYLCFLQSFFLIKTERIITRISVSQTDCNVPTMLKTSSPVVQKPHHIDVSWYVQRYIGQYK